MYAQLTELYLVASQRDTMNLLKNKMRKKTIKIILTLHRQL
jgi:hypothetical protein